MELKNIVPWGRSFDEYQEFFGLTDGDLSKTILGCGDGPASFNAELTSRGGNVISVDPAYQAGKSESRYLPESLPKLSFQDKQFDLALCSHYLFLYSEHVDLEQHIASIKELCRVASEARIYPLLSLDGELSSHLAEVISGLSKVGLVCTKENVKYQFQKGATQMLVVKSV